MWHCFACDSDFDERGWDCDGYYCPVCGSDDCMETIDDDEEVDDGDDESPVSPV